MFAFSAFCPLIFSRYSEPDVSTYYFKQSFHLLSVIHSNWIFVEMELHQPQSFLKFSKVSGTADTKHNTGRYFSYSTFIWYIYVFLSKTRSKIMIFYCHFQDLLINYHIRMIKRVDSRFYTYTKGFELVTGVMLNIFCEVNIFVKFCDFFRL